MTAARVLVLYTGGTIGMVPADPADPASPLVPAPGERLARHLPNPLDGVAWDLVGLTDDRGQPVEPLDSSDISPRHWPWMARSIAAAQLAYDGVVVLHGTDTMAYTGSALAFLLRDLAKPVVLTGAQHPLTTPGGDGAVNFANALRIAGTKASGLPPVPEVSLCFGDVLLRACRATKVSTSAGNAFASPNHPPLGRVRDGIIRIEPSLLRPPPAVETACRADAALEPGVVIATLSPGLGGAALGALLGHDSVKGCVLRGFGSGNAPADPHLLEAIRRTVAAGKPVVGVSQCLEGMVETGRYHSGLGLARAGVLDGGDMTPEAALAKLMWLLPQSDGESLRRAMAADLRGERTPS
ncbi:hypothetical protein A6A04_11705 [Paramagnetospirillum marisnigri]|uniref:L-asparaginase 1 n=1 Tax=Paramagnetospirillum marisnigri TaxID=1285242 RepID=A0A178MVY4_9PROT|nr:asparaginase [Paramagnetospirillum marisnigri]OAN54586.1 hypothetical protein A6A04_11705 [Paramagnetospirillum marisnigri]